jgi:LysR family glycine cleavage system transcriptional activator
MSYRLPPLSALRAFEAAARHLSFKRAAEELFVTPAAVSQQIKALESYLGAPLFRRLPRALELSEHGRAMLPKLRDGLDCLAAAVELVRVRPEGLLTVHAPPSFAQRWLVPRLSRFSTLHPDAELRLASDVCNIDGLGRGPESLLTDPRDAGSAVAVRFGVADYPGFCRYLLLAPEYVLVCSPELLARTGPLMTPAALGGRSSSTTSRSPMRRCGPIGLSGFARRGWRMWMPAGGRVFPAQCWCWRLPWAGRAWPWPCGRWSRPTSGRDAW